jgi:HEPN domain-containing protein
MPLDKPQKEILYWYVHRAYHNCRQAQTLFTTFNNVESIISSFEAIEFAIKAMCKICNIPYAPKHFGADTAEIIAKLAESVSQSHMYSKDKLLQTMPIVMSYSDELRVISRYGLERENVPIVAPPRVFSRAYAESVVEDAKFLCDILRKMEWRIRWGLQQN